MDDSNTSSKRTRSNVDEESVSQESPKKARLEDENESKKDDEVINTNGDANTDNTKTNGNSNDSSNTTQQDNANNNNNNNNSDDSNKNDSKPSDPLQKLLHAVADRTTITKTLEFLKLDAHKNYLEKEVAEGFKLLEKIHLISEDKTSDKRELLLLAYKYYQLIYPQQLSVPPVITSRAQLTIQLQALRHLQTITHATHTITSQKEKKMKNLPTDSDDEGDTNMDKGNDETEKDEKGHKSWKNSAAKAQSALAHAHLTPLAPNDHTFQLILNYISSTNVPKSSFQVMDIISVGEEKDVANEDGKGKDEDANVKQEKVLLWSGGPACSLLDVVANGWRCENGAVFYDCVSQAIAESNFELEEAVLLLSEVTLDANQQSVTKKDDVPLFGPTNNASHLLCSGRWKSDPSVTNTHDGYTIPGKFINVGIKSDFDNNKYIVYSPDKIKLRFIVRLYFYNATNATKPSASASTASAPSSSSSSHSHHPKPKPSLPPALTQPLSSPFGSGKWSYSGENGWKDYEANHNKQIEDKFSGGAVAFRLIIGTTDYTIDFKKMVQYQTLYKTKTRKIRRL